MGNKLQKIDCLCAREKCNCLFLRTPTYDGKPTPIFDTVRKDQITFLKLSNDGMSFTGSLDQRKMKFFDDFYERANHMVDWNFIREQEQKQCDDNFV